MAAESLLEDVAGEIQALRKGAERGREAGKLAIGSHSFVDRIDGAAEGGVDAEFRLNPVIQPGTVEGAEHSVGTAHLPPEAAAQPQVLVGEFDEGGVDLGQDAGNTARAPEVLRGAGIQSAEEIECIPPPADEKRADVHLRSMRSLVRSTSEC